MKRVVLTSLVLAGLLAADRAAEAQSSCKVCAAAQGVHEELRGACLQNRVPDVSEVMQIEAISQLEEPSCEDARRTWRRRIAGFADALERQRIGGEQRPNKAVGHADTR